MRVALDANVLIYSADVDSPHHTAANRALAALFSSGEEAYLFPPVIVAFLRVTTHPRLQSRPFSREDAFSKLRTLLGQQQVRFGGADDTLVELLEATANAANATGNLIHDAEIVALMRQHGVNRILTADRDFQKFAGIEVLLLES